MATKQLTSGMVGRPTGAKFLIYTTLIVGLGGVQK